MLALVLIMLSVGCIPSHAADTSGTCGTNVSWNLSASGVLTISGTGTMDDYMWSAPWYHYELRDSVKTVVIESGITHVGNYAFSQLNSLVNVTIADSVTSMGDNVFSNSKSLKSIKMPSKLKSLGERVFEKCEKLESIVIPDEVKVLHQYLFSQCENLRTIQIGKGVTRVEEGVFHRTSTTSRTIYLPDGITYFAKSLTTNESDFVYVRRNSQTAAYFYETGYPFIDPDYPELLVRFYREDDSEKDGYLMAVRRLTETAEPAMPPEIKIIGLRFYHDSQLTQITVPEGVVELEGNVFYASTKLKKVQLPSTLQTVGNGVFIGCISLKEVNLPSGLQKISGDMFMNCSSLQQLAIPTSVKEIAYQAFYSTGIQKVYIPKSVKTIGDRNFTGATVYCHSGSAAQTYCQNNQIDYILLDQKQRIALPAKLSRLESEVMMATGGNIYEISNKVTAIDSLAFANITGNPVFIISANVSNIANDAFTGTNPVILALPGSAAAEYAVEKGLDLVLWYGT